VTAFHLTLTTMRVFRRHGQTSSHRLACRRGSPSQRLSLSLHVYWYRITGSVLLASEVVAREMASS
jgi:hypothetical protein